VLSYVKLLDAAAEERDPDSFNPNVNLRSKYHPPWFLLFVKLISMPPDYDEIDLPVFTCSARDYVRLKGLVFIPYCLL
jgi:hypothetical protein